MKRSHIVMLMTAAAVLSLAACKPAGQKEAAKPETKAEDPIASAMLAAPEAVAANATIVAVKPDGSMETLREGSNGFTCMPDNPVTPGPDPMCMDANALAWGLAWMKHENPAKETPGFMYMLAGGTDASNTDPFAEKPTEGADWVHTGPHVMVVGSELALQGYPSSPDPDTSQPYVMWAGTPYAHLMIPVK
jgi:hypothetical protein